MFSASLPADVQYWSSSSSIFAATWATSLTGATTAAAPAATASASASASSAADVAVVLDSPSGSSDSSSSAAVATEKQKSTDKDTAKADGKKEKKEDFVVVEDGFIGGEVGSEEIAVVKKAGSRVSAAVLAVGATMR